MVPRKSSLTLLFQSTLPKMFDDSDDFKAFLETITVSAIREWDAEAEYRNFALTGVMYGPDGQRIVFPEEDAE